MREYNKILVGAIGLFHAFLAVHSVYLFASDFEGASLYLFSPLLLLIFTLFWLGIFFKKRLFAFAYFLLTIFETIMRIFFSKTQFGDVFGDVLFPANWVFVLVLLFIYRYHFGDRSAK